MCLKVIYLYIHIHLFKIAELDPSELSFVAIKLKKLGTSDVEHPILLEPVSLTQDSQAYMSIHPILLEPVSLHKTLKRT